MCTRGDKGRLKSTDTTTCLIVHFFLTTSSHCSITRSLATLSWKEKESFGCISFGFYLFIYFFVDKLEEHNKRLFFKIRNTPLIASLLILFLLVLCVNAHFFYSSYLSSLLTNWRDLL